MSVLLLIWLSFSCQNCFADSGSESAQSLHVAMNCCPPGDHDEHDQQTGMSGCDNNYLMNQPVIAEEVSVQLTDFQIALLPVSDYRFEANYPDLIQPVIRQPEHFSDRLFLSYRILLI